MGIFLKSATTYENSSTEIRNRTTAKQLHIVNVELGTWNVWYTLPGEKLDKNKF